MHAIAYLIWGRTMNITRPEQLSNLIKEHRKKTGLTQKEVSDLIGIRPATVSDFENKAESSKLETLFKILAALNLQLDVSSRDSNEHKENQLDENW